MHPSLPYTAPFAPLLAAACATLALGGCGGGGSASTATGSSKATAPSGGQLGLVGGYSRLDGDSDVDDIHPPQHDHYDDSLVLSRYGSRADRADAAAIAALVKSYYAASAAGEAPRACSLLWASLAGGVAREFGAPLPV